MILPMHRTNLIEQRSQPSDFFPSVTVVRLEDMRDQVREWRLDPVPIDSRNGRLGFGQFERIDDLLDGKT